MIYLLAFVVLVLAVSRATRVLWYDEIALPLRTWVLTKWPKPSKPSKLVRCYWCLSVWVAFFATLYTHCVACFAGWLPWHTMALLPLTWFAVAYASAWILDKEGIVDGI